MSPTSMVDSSSSVDVQTVEQRLVALEQLLQRVQEQALAEAQGRERK